MSFVGVGAYCLFTYANQRLPATLLTLYGIVQPLLTSLMAYAVLGEAPRSGCLAGASLIVLGLVLTAVGTVATPPRRSELENAPGMAPDLAAPLLPVNYSRHYDHSRHATSFPKPPPPPPRKLHATSFSKPPPPPPPRSVPKVRREQASWGR